MNYKHYKEKMLQLSKKALCLIILLFSITISSNAYSIRWEKTASYNVYYAEGPSTGKRIDCYTCCEPETDNCAIKYIYGGRTFDVEYTYDELGDGYMLPKSKSDRIERTFLKLCPSAFDSESNNLSYAVSRDGRYELYIIWGDYSVPNAWLLKNGKLVSALWFMN